MGRPKGSKNKPKSDNIYKIVGTPQVTPRIIKAAQRDPTMMAGSAGADRDPSEQPRKRREPLPILAGVVSQTAATVVTPERKRRGDSKEECERCGKREVIYKTSSGKICEACIHKVMA